MQPEPMSEKEVAFLKGIYAKAAPIADKMLELLNEQNNAVCIQAFGIAIANVLHALPAIDNLTLDEVYDAIHAAAFFEGLRLDQAAANAKTRAL